MARSYAVLAVLAVAGLAVANACTKVNRPVCAEDGQSYMNECLAARAGVAVKKAGYCKGAALRFLGSARESAATISSDTMERFAKQGFKYVGRSQLSKAPREPLSNPAASRPQPKAGDVIKSYRYSMDGHVYASTFTYDPAGKESAAGLEPRIPTSAAATKPATRRLLGDASIIGTDERFACAVKAYPSTAVGQLEFEIDEAPYICSGALVSPRHVLTAAHCVYDQAGGSFVKGISFNPGRYHDAKTGSVVDPYPALGWSHVTLQSLFRDSDESMGDVALITLNSTADEELGTLGVVAACNSGPLNVQITGYPSDMPDGECKTSRCSVQYNCTAESTKHTCDTIFGMSGSAVYDDKYHVRGVHVRGLTVYNEFTTITKLVKDLVVRWVADKDIVGFVKPGNQANRRARGL